MQYVMTIIFWDLKKGKSATNGANVDGSALKSLLSVFLEDQLSKSLPELHCHVNTHKYSLQRLQKKEELPSACLSSSFSNYDHLCQRYFLILFAYLLGAALMMLMEVAKRLLAQKCHESCPRNANFNQPRRQLIFNRLL